MASTNWRGTRLYCHWTNRCRVSSNTSRLPRKANMGFAAAYIHKLMSLGSYPHIVSSSYISRKIACTALMSATTPGSLHSRSNQALTRHRLCVCFVVCELALLGTLHIRYVSQLALSTLYTSANAPKPMKHVNLSIAQETLKAFIWTRQGSAHMFAACKPLISPRLYGRAGSGISVQPQFSPLLGACASTQAANHCLTVCML